MKTPRSYPALLGATVLLSMPAAFAETLYWNKTTDHLIWSNTSNTNWTTTSGGTVYQSWTASDDAVISTPSAVIDLGGSAVTASSLTVTSGATFTGSGSTSTGAIISGAGGFSGGGSFSLVDNATNNAVVKISLTDSTLGHTGYNGTITVGTFTSASSGLQLGADNKVTTPSVPLTGSDANTLVVLNGGNLFIAGGVAGTTAVIGSLSGTGAVLVGNVFSSNSGTRTLEVNQSANTTFSGVIGATTLSQTNNVLALTKTGSGSLTIQASGASGYSGATTASQGALYLSGTFGSTTSGGTNINQGDFVVKSGATLGLDGTFNVGGAKTVTIESGGTLDAGTFVFDGIGTTTSAGLVFQGTTRISFSLGTAKDMVTLADASMIGSASGGDGSILFNFSNAGGTTAGSTYDLISFGGTTKGIVLTAFALSQSSIDAGWTGSFGYGGDGNTLQFTVTAIPEPGVFAVLAGGAGLGLALFRRGRRKALKPASTLLGTAIACAVTLMVSAPRVVAAPNLVPNGGFESAEEGWAAFVPADSKDKGCVFMVESDAAHEGRMAARLQANTIARFCIAPEPITVQPGDYELSAWVRADSDFAVNRKHAGFVLRVSCFKPGEKEPVETRHVNWKGETSDSADFPNNAMLPTQWTQIKVIVTVPAGSNRVKLDFFLWHASGALLIDDVRFTRRD